MPEGPDGKTIIIVKKVVGHGGHHGGSWKVAYADFVTAMMALFLTLWLVNSASVVTRERIANYFQRPGVYEDGSGTPLEIGGAGILPSSFAPPAEKGAKTTLGKNIYDPDEGANKGAGYGAGKGGTAGVKDGEGEGSGKTAGGDSGVEGMGEGGESREIEERNFEKVAQEIGQFVAGQDIAKLLGQVDINLSAKGMHVEIMDTKDSSMFAPGSAKILPEAEQRLLKIAKIIMKLPNPIDIEGHTDASQYRSRNGNYDNWDLSGDRAHEARRVMVEAGMKERQIARVVAFASQRLKIPSNPFHHSNRRISISMRYTQQAENSLEGVGFEKSESSLERTKRLRNKSVSKESRSKDIFSEFKQEALRLNDGSGPGVEVSPIESESTASESSTKRHKQSEAPRISPEQDDFIFGEDAPFFHFDY